MPHKPKLRLKSQEKLVLKAKRVLRSPHAKGSSFERRIVKALLTATADVNSLPTEIYRTPLSGGHPFLKAGDLMIDQRLIPVIPFAIECKCYRNWHPGIMLDLRNSQEGRWHNQCLAAAKACERLPMLVLTGNRVGIWVSAPYNVFKNYCAELVRATPRVVYKWEGARWVMFPFDVLLTAITAKATSSAKGSQ